MDGIANASVLNFADYTVKCAIVLIIQVLFDKIAIMTKEMLKI
jgi:hypothetical protein